MQKNHVYYHDYRNQWYIIRADVALNYKSKANQLKLKLYRGEVRREQGKDKENNSS